MENASAIGEKVLATNEGTLHLFDEVYVDHGEDFFAVWVGNTYAVCAGNDSTPDDYYYDLYVGKGDDESMVLSNGEDYVASCSDLGDTNVVMYALFGIIESRLADRLGNVL